jgi:hypothetical protein
VNFRTNRKIHPARRVPVGWSGKKDFTSIALADHYRNTFLTTLSTAFAKTERAKLWAIFLEVVLR